MTLAPEDWDRFCDDLLPAFLLQEGTDTTLVSQITADLRRRAESYAASSARARDVLRAPFLEETVGYEPRQAPVSVLTSVAIVVRCSLLEEAHANGPIDAGGIQAITTLAAGPLLTYLNASYNLDFTGAPAGCFAGLDTRHPRAWAALSQIAGHSGGRVGYHPPAGPVPSLPDETVDARVTAAGHVVLSAIDPRFDQRAIDLLQQVASGQLPLVFVSHLSRLSRNLDKLFSMVEFILAHGAAILTTNYLLRPGETWVRGKRLVPPSTDDPLGPLHDHRGLTGAHRRTVEDILKANNLAG